MSNTFFFESATRVILSTQPEIQEAEKRRNLMMKD
jgi:hypothetical protein